MIYIIGGAPRCGKTTLATKLSKELGIPLLITDTIQKAIRPFIPVEDHANLLPFHHIEEESHYNNDEMYAEHAPEDLVQAYIKQSETYWRGFEKLITYSLEVEQEYIIEGHILHPAFIKTLEKQEALRVVYLYKTDARKIAEEMRLYPNSHDWVKERTENPDTFMKIGTVIQNYGGYLSTEATKYGYQSFSTDHFEETIENAFTQLVSEYRV